jgi:tetratricopeptide (TPR) repeat protein
VPESERAETQHSPRLRRASLNRVWWWLAIGLAALATTTAPARADSDAEARRFFEAGKASFDAGSFEEALSFFERAFERSHRPQLRYNIGLAADRLRQDEKALDAFYAYLADVPDAENRAEVEGRIRALEKAQADREAAAATTPEAVAREANDNDSTGLASTSGAQADSGSGKPITKKWWFWTGIGAVVVTGVIIGIVAAGGSNAQAEPFDSRSGIAVMALTER